MNAKYFFSILIIPICFICSAFSQNTITDMKVETLSNETRFIIFSNGFGGDCTAMLAIDSVKESCFYISCKYESGAKCSGMYKSDTISLGRLQEGEYKIEFSFIDVYNPPQDNSQPTEIYEKEFIFRAEISFPQENFSFVDDDMQWSYITVESWDENPDEPSGKLPATMTTTYKYFGDTIINSISYKKMYRTTDNGKNWSEFGYFRLEGKQVYYINKNEEKEKLVYNFSKDMELTFRIHPNKEHALKSDTIMVNNVKKARWGFYPKDGDSEAFYQDISLDDKYYFEDVIIEDIGSVFVPTFDGLRDCPYGMTGCPYYTYLLCVQKNGDVIWHNPNYEECYYEQTAIDNIADQQIALSPNPVKDKLTLSLPNTENEIKIFDLQGKLLLQQNVGFSAEIIVSMLPMGTYVLVVNGESYKFVKE